MCSVRRYEVRSERDRLISEAFLGHRYLFGDTFKLVAVITIARIMEKKMRISISKLGAIGAGVELAGQGIQNGATSYSTGCTGMIYQRK